MVKNNLTITHPELCKEWDYEKNEKGPENYTYGSHAKVFWRIDYYDKTENKNFVLRWSDRIEHRTIDNRGCPYLSGQAVLEGFNDLASKNPELAALWHPTKNGNLKPTEITCNSTRKIWWYKKYFDRNTNKEFEFEWLCQVYVMNQKKDKEKCPYLTGKRLFRNFNDLATTHPQIAQEWNYEKNNLTPQEVMIGSNKEVYFTCKYGHTYKTNIYKRLYNGCPYCSASKAEHKAHNILNKNNISFIIEKRLFDEIKRNPYDIFLSEKNLLVELDGKQHFEKIQFFEDKKPFTERIETDNKKNKYAFENSVPLLRIPYMYFEDELKMEALVMDFIRTRIIPKEIIDFYSQYDFSNYAELAEKYNETLKLKAS